MCQSKTDTFECKRCGESKDASEFPSDSRCSIGISLTCKECCNKRRRDKYKDDDVYRGKCLSRQRKYIDSGYYAKGYCPNARTLSDTYVIQAIKRSTNLKRQDIPQQLIETWRETIKIRKLYKEIKHEQAIKQKDEGGFVKAVRGNGGEEE